MTKPKLLSRRLFAFLFPVAAGAQTASKKTAPKDWNLPDRKHHHGFQDANGKACLPYWLENGDFDCPTSKNPAITQRDPYGSILLSEKDLVEPSCPHEWIASSTFSVRANLLGNQANLFVPVEHCARCGVLRLPNAYWGQR